MARGNQTNHIGNPYSLISQRANLRYYVAKCHRRDATIQRRDEAIQRRNVIIDAHQEELNQNAEELLQNAEVTARRVRKVSRLRAIIEDQKDDIRKRQRRETKLLLELAKMKRKLEGAKHGNDAVVMYTKNLSVKPIVMTEEEGDDGDRK